MKNICKDEYEIKDVLTQNGYTVIIVDNDDGENLDMSYDINILRYHGNQSFFDMTNKDQDRTDEYKYNICFVYKDHYFF